MTLSELNRNCHRAKPTATVTVPASPHQADQSRSGRGALASFSPTPTSNLGQRAGTLRSPPAVRATASGAAMSSIGNGRNTRASSSGSPGSSQAMTRIAGSTVILAKLVPPISRRWRGRTAGNR